jgi:2-dehydropantoate 2-reductase
MDEVIRVAQACGVPLDRKMADEQIEYTRNFPAYKTSMLQDFESGASLEIDAVIGNVVKLADIHHVDVPVMRCCRVLLKSVDTKRTEKL